MKKYFNIIFLLFISLVTILSSEAGVKVIKNADEMSWNEAASGAVNLDTGNGRQSIVVIDPGHGGRDPGKIGVNNALEKDINLSISLKLKELLAQKKIQVIVTREEDVGLYSESDSNKKRADLNARVALIKESNADIAISIHQNSFTEEYVKGAQVFYYSTSEQGKRLAQIMQETLVETLADGNHRKAKPNSNYFMLQKVECPLVIVECGYLSNREEAALLIDDEYQGKMAQAICQGILAYLDIN
ncbi:N-acetylmuramoyl-L-alanine amidase [Anaerotaenia torta]|uniref:N-acetylmuramoyl-L-alanine amidase n=1 Tax=Anaerotaenia torta TaxID=433293 RepID=UPI003D1FCC25